MTGLVYGLEISRKLENFKILSENGHKTDAHDVRQFKSKWFIGDYEYINYVEHRHHTTKVSKSPGYQPRSLGGDYRHTASSQGNRWYVKVAQRIRYS